MTTAPDARIRVNVEDGRWAWMCLECPEKGDGYELPSYAAIVGLAHRELHEFQSSYAQTTIE